VIYAVNDPSVIRHNLLRSFAYIYSGPVADSLRLTQPQEVAAFEKNIARLADIFLEALKANDQGAFERMTALAARSKETFNRIVFAETVDSIYCSKDTYALVAGESSVFKPVFDAFLARNDFEEGLGYELGVPWFSAGLAASAAPQAPESAGQVGAAPGAEESQLELAPRSGK
jgi:hypothetical protein